LNVRGVNSLVKRQLASAVHVTPMSNVKHGHHLSLVVNLIDDTKATYSDTPTCTPAQLSAAARPGVFAKSVNRGLHSLIFFRWKLG
jgi:hypothetical protein